MVQRKDFRPTSYNRGSISDRDREIIQNRKKLISQDRNPETGNKFKTKDEKKEQEARLKNSIEAYNAHVDIKTGKTYKKKGKFKK